MDAIKLGLVEARFADIIWDSAPLLTTELVNICAEELEWKRTTTYTVLKKLCDRGIFHTQNSIVTVLISREEFHAIQGEQFLEESYKGSLPAFIAAFTKRKPLSEEEAEEIHSLIDTYRRRRQ
jgi:predicted transcriptional regulator